MASSTVSSNFTKTAERIVATASGTVWKRFATFLAAAVYFLPCFGMIETPRVPF
jgi:hypothetical protein